MRKIRIISGIEPSKKGAGKFLSFLINTFEEQSIPLKVSYIKTPDNKIVRVLKKSFLFKYLKELFYLVYRNRNYDVNNNAFINILFHPQSLGLKASTKIIKSSDKLYIYVLDNFFFCKKSYNYLDLSYNTCLLCCKDKNYSIENNCRSFPNNYTHEEYIDFVETLENNLGKIVFLSQNKMQTNLLVHNFGNSVNIKEIGMFTGEFSFEEQIVYSNNLQYDVLYHNTLDIAKGIKYFLALCQEMPEYSFVVPNSKSEMERVVGCKIQSMNNLEYVPCTWESGLKQLVQNSKITIVPSLWSAPIEGALLKSLFYGNLVAIVEQEFAFNQELPENICLRLNMDITSSSMLVANAINESVVGRHEARVWLEDFVSEKINSIIKFTKDI